MKAKQWLGSVVLVLSAFFAGNTYAEDKQPRIVGGSLISISDAPWQVFLRGVRGNTTISCGGSIIADNFILTAAHCLYRLEDFTFTVYAGSAYWPNGTALPVTGRYLHPNYDDNTLDNDIALLRISGTLPSTARSILLVDEANQIAFNNEAANGTADNLFVSGWGSTSQDGSGDTDDLMGVLMTGVPDNQCSWLIDGFGNYVPALGDITICANSTSNEGTCTGDSGGPLVWQDPSHAGDTDLGARLIGIVSYGLARECGNTGSPDGFAEVSHYLTWIAQTMDQNRIDDSGDDSGDGGSGGGGGGGSMGGLLTLSLFGLLYLSRRKHLS
ncbi:S1 family serine peptidase [Enterovibrio coralii]|uniref:Peptidase S1 domain-containing protein n=1 Tax=Enterovibrio coralii TaxID=294935 RepID=A0A135I2T4_9GAMM|nr:serine protease [Enterovibrio coralii]KXF79759.1 hypothetical protein ATN88_12640 [Enterovibrio coralii]